MNLVHTILRSIQDYLDQFRTAQINSELGSEQESARVSKSQQESARVSKSQQESVRVSKCQQMSV